MAKKKYRLTTCNICGSQAPANFMVRHPKKVTATSRNTVGGKEVVGAILGFQTSQKALERSLLTSRKRTHTTYRTVWMCEECSGKKSVGTLAKESLTREAKDLANEGEKLSNDLSYLKLISLSNNEKIISNNSFNDFSFNKSITDSYIKKHYTYSKKSKKITIDYSNAQKIVYQNILKFIKKKQYNKLTSIYLNTFKTLNIVKNKNDKK